MTKKEVNFIDLNKEMEKRGTNFKDDVVYILADNYEDDCDILNENTPDVYKILKTLYPEVVIVKQNEYVYSSLKSENFIFPLLMNITVDVLGGLILYFITKFISSDETKLSVKFIKKESKNKYVEYHIEGNKSEVLEALEKLKE